MTQLDKHIYGLDKKAKQALKEIEKEMELVRIEALIDISKLNENSYFCNQLTKIKEYIINN